MEEATKPVELEIPKIASQQHSPPIILINNNKRKLSNANNFYTSPYFKVRAVLQQLRPQLIQVLQSPDFRHCKAANELQIQMKHLMGLYKQMTMEAEPMEKPTPKPQLFRGKNSYDRQSWDTDRDRKPPELLQRKRPCHQSAEIKPPTCIDAQMKLDDDHDRKSYIVGGSAFGWNFITFRDGIPVYYGVTKESFRNRLRSRMSATVVSSLNS